MGTSRQALDLVRDNRAALRYTAPAEGFRMMRAGWVALIFAGALHGAAVAGAIELQLVDQESDRQTSPAQAPDSGCTTDADGAFIPHLDNDSASLQVRTN